MGLKYWWLGLVLLVGMLALVGVRWFRASARPRADAGVRWLANTAAIRALPRYRELAHRRLHWLRLEALFVALAVAGALLLASRPVWVASDSIEMRSRDIMLCLDVSGSMLSADRVILESYLRIVDELQGERIGMVVWNSSASIAFPLTDDYTFIQERLELMLDAVGSDGTSNDAQTQAVLLGALQGSRGSSLIGDGLMSCLLRFDQQAEVRPRTVILATDNELAGTPFFTVEEATQQAVEDQVLVMGLMPRFKTDDETGERSASAQERAQAALGELLGTTGGEIVEISGADLAVEERIIARIESQERKAIMVLARSQSLDHTAVPAALLAVGLLGMLVALVRGRA